VDGTPDTSFTSVGSADAVDVTGTGGTVTFTDSNGLAFDTIYDYRVKAIAIDGTPSNYSNTSPPITTAPVAPVNLSVSPVAGSDNKLQLSWTDNARHSQYFRIYRQAPGETSLTYYTYTYGTDTYATGAKQVTSPGAGKGNVIIWQDTGLNVNSTYIYYVVAQNSAGQSDASNTASGMTLTTQTVPAAPSMGGKAGSTGSDGKADPKTTIRAYFTDQSTNEDSFRLERINNDDPNSVYTTLAGFPKPGAAGTGTFYDYYDTNLPVDTSFSYRAFATNIKGDSPPSNILTAATVPVKPVSVQAAGLSDTKIKLTWTDNAHHSQYFRIYRQAPGETSLTYYTYTYGTDTYATGTPGKGNTLTYTDTGLNVNSSYSYYVTAQNNAGQSDPSETVTATSFPSNPPGAPSDLRAAATASPTQVNLNWLDNSSDESGFIVEREAEGATAFTALPGANPGDPTVGPQSGIGSRVYYSDKTAADDTTFTYRVKATNPAGDSGHSNQISATTAPTAPSGLNAVAVAGTSDSIKLTWTDNSKHEDGFYIFRKGPTDTGFNNFTFVTGVAGTANTITYTDSGLSAGSSYSYYVTAYNGGGQSAASNTATVSTNSAGPAPVPSITSLSPGGVPVNSPDTTVTINGLNFLPTTSVTLGSTPLTISSQGAALMVVTIPAAQLTTARTATLTVTNPPSVGGGGGSATASFVIAPVVTTGSGGAGYVYYSRSDNTAWRAKLDGTTDTQVTTGDQPRLSPNSRLLAVKRGGSADPTYQKNIWIHDLQTSADTQVFSNNDYVVNYGFTPDNSQLIFDYSCGIYGVNVDGTGQHSLLGADCYDDSPAPNPVSGVIAFHNIHIGLLLANAEGSGRAQIPHTLAGDVTASWSPDGKTLSFLSGRDVFLIKPDGTGRTQLSFLAPGDTFTGAAPWTADGSALIVAGTIGGVKGLYAVSTSGSGAVTRLTIASGANPDFAGSVTNTLIAAGPTVAITSPANNASFTAPATIPVTITATPVAGSGATISGYELFLNNVSQGKQATGSYTLTGLAAGVYTLTAQATDSNGLVGVSGSVTVKVVGPPTVAITSPANNASYTAPATVTVTASATPNAGSGAAITQYELFLNNVSQGTSANGSFTLIELSF